MNFDFSDDQNALRNEIRKFLSRESPLTQARALLEGEGHHAQDVWSGMAQLGVTSLMLPEDCGGLLLETGGNQKGDRHDTEDRQDAERDQQRRAATGVFNAKARRRRGKGGRRKDEGGSG